MQLLLNASDRFRWPPSIVLPVELRKNGRQQEERGIGHERDGEEEEVEEVRRKHYLSDRDVQVLSWGMQQVRHIFATAPLAQLAGEEVGEMGILVVGQLLILSH